MSCYFKPPIIKYSSDLTISEYYILSEYLNCFRYSETLSYFLQEKIKINKSIYFHYKNINYEQFTLLIRLPLVAAQDFSFSEASRTQKEDLDLQVITIDESYTRAITDSHLQNSCSDRTQSVTCSVVGQLCSQLQQTLQTEIKL